MNKRIKKKWSRIARLETKVAQLMAENILLTESLKARVKAHGELEERVNVNTLATNNRFNQVEAENKGLRIDLDKAIIEFNKPKKSWFGRK